MFPTVQPLPLYPTAPDLLIGHCLFYASLGKFLRPRPLKKIPEILPQFDETEEPKAQIHALPSRTKSLDFLILHLAGITSVNFAVSAHNLTSKQPAPLPPPSFILNVTTVTLALS